MMVTNKEEEMHWYISTNHLSFMSDVSFYCRNRLFYGFKKEPTIELIELYDLREVGYGDYNWIMKGMS